MSKKPSEPNEIKKPENAAVIEAVGGSASPAALKPGRAKKELVDLFAAPKKAELAAALKLAAPPTKCVGHVEYEWSSDQGWQPTGNPC